MYNAIINKYLNLNLNKQLHHIFAACITQCLKRKRLSTSEALALITADSDTDSSEVEATTSGSTAKFSM